MSESVSVFVSNFRGYIGPYAWRVVRATPMKLIVDTRGAR